MFVFCKPCALNLISNSACKIVFGHLKVQYIDSAKLKSRATDCNNNDNNNNSNNNNNNNNNSNNNNYNYNYNYDNDNDKYR